MVTNFLKGIVAYIPALRDVRRYNLGKYFLFSGLIALFLLLVIGTAGWAVSDNLTSYFLSWFPSLAEYEKASTVGSIIVGAIIVLLGLIFYRNILIIALAPLMSFLSEELENKMYPERQKPETSLKVVLYSLLRGLRLAIRSLFWELLYTVLVLLVTTILPFLSILSVPLIFMIQAYYIGVGNLDYTLERKLNVSQTIRFSGQHKWYALGIGAVYLAGIFSVIGLLFVPVLAATASTRGTLERLG